MMLIPIPIPMHYGALPLPIAISFLVMVILSIVLIMYGSKIRYFIIKAYSNMSAFIVYHRYKSKNEKTAKDILDTSKRLNNHKDDNQDNDQ